MPSQNPHIQRPVGVAATYYEREGPRQRFRGLSARQRAISEISLGISHESNYFRLLGHQSMNAHRGLNERDIR